MQLGPKLVFLPWADVHGTCTATSRSYLAMPATPSINFHPRAFYASRGRHWWLSLSHCLKNNATVAFRHFIRIGAVKSGSSSLVHNFSFKTSLIQVWYKSSHETFNGDKVKNDFFDTGGDQLQHLQYVGLRWFTIAIPRLYVATTFCTNSGASARGPRFHGPTDLPRIFPNSLTGTVSLSSCTSRHKIICSPTLGITRCTRSFRMMKTSSDSHSRHAECC